MATKKVKATVNTDGTDSSFQGYRHRFISDAEGYQVDSEDGTVSFRVHSFDDIATVIAEIEA